MSDQTVVDTYRIDTNVAVANLAALYDSSLRIEKLMRDQIPAASEKTTSAVTKQGVAMVALGNIISNVATRAMVELRQQVVLAVDDYIEEQRALEQLKLAVGGHAAALANQAEALEHSSGASKESLMQVQAMLARFGVAPADINKTTKAIVDYSTAMRVDVVTATQMFTRAVENGGSKLETLGLEFESTGYAAQDMLNAVNAINEKFGGASDTENNTTYGRAIQVKVAFEDLRKEFGGMLVEFESKYHVLDKITESFKFWKEYVSGDLEKEVARQQDLNQLYDRRVFYADQILDLRTDLDVAQAAGDSAEVNRINFELAQARNRSEKVEEYIKQLEHAKEVSESITDPGSKGPGRRTKAGRNDDEEAAKAAQRFQEAEEKRLNDAEKRTRQAEIRDKKDAERAYKEKEEAERKHLAALQESRDKAWEYRKNQMESENARLMQQHQQQMKNIQEAFGPLLQWGEQLFGGLANLFADKMRQILTTNDSINRRLTEASIERRRMELEERGIYKTSDELRKEAQQEAKAADDERLAQLLANMAIEAGKNAIMQTGEGIGSLAKYDYPGAALHFTAAGVFGLLAGGTAAAAYGVSQGRGMTTSERRQLESDQQAQEDIKKERARRAKEKEEVAAPESKTVVNVYNLGITGQTEAEQGRELARIQQTYSDLGTGQGRP